MHAPHLIILLDTYLPWINFDQYKLRLWQSDPSALFQLTLNNPSLDSQTRHPWRHATNPGGVEVWRKIHSTKPPCLSICTFYILFSNHVVWISTTRPIDVHFSGGTSVRATTLQATTLCESQTQWRTITQTEENCLHRPIYPCISFISAHWPTDIHLSRL